MENKINKLYKCNLCNKNYSSYQSLWNHNNNFHNNDKTNINNKSLTCDLCNKLFKTRSSKSIHKKKCLNKNNNQIEVLKEITKQRELDIKEKELDIKQKELEIKLQLIEEEKELLKLKIESDNYNNLTIKKLNKKLKEKYNLIKNSTINSHNNTQNIYNNTIQLIGLGKEEVIEVLTMNEKKQIINARYGCLEKLIQIIHCGKYNQFKNIILTNMKDNFIYKYDDVKKQFIITRKSETINNLLDCRISDIEIIYNELLDKNKIDEKTKDAIEKFINKFYNDNNKYLDIDGISHQSYKHYKINEVKILLYNNQEYIANDVSLLLTTNEL